MNLNFKKIILVIGALISLSAPQAFAMMRAPFPNSSSLQPLPADIQPNITNNANSSVGTTSASSPQSADSDTGSQATSSKSEEGGEGIAWYFYLGIIVGLISVFSIRYFLRKKK